MRFASTPGEFTLNGEPGGVAREIDHAGNAMTRLAINLWPQRPPQID
jgi:hypothetical protein